MAIKKIRMRPEGGNDYGDVLHPETSADMVLSGDGTIQSEVEQVKTNLESHLADYATFKDNTATELINRADLVNGQVPASQLGNVPEPKKPYVIGTYTGSGSSNRVISVGFHPSAVLVWDQRMTPFSTSNTATYYRRAFAVRGSSVNAHLSDFSGSVLQINPGGFIVRRETVSSNYPRNIDTNGNGDIYHYIAFK